MVESLHFHALWSFSRTYRLCWPWAFLSRKNIYTKFHLFNNLFFAGWKAWSMVCQILCKLSYPLAVEVKTTWSFMWWLLILRWETFKKKSTFNIVSQCKLSGIHVPCGHLNDFIIVTNGLEESHSMTFALSYLILWPCVLWSVVRRTARTWMKWTTYLSEQTEWMILYHFYERCW